MNRPYIRPEVRKQVILNKNVKKKRINRSHINDDIVKQVNLKKKQEEEEALRRQQEYMFEMQRQAFLQQQAAHNAQMIIEEEQEEDHGMSM